MRARGETIKSWALKILAPAIAATFAIAAGLLIGAERVQDARDEAVSARASASAIASQAAALRADRDRLRAERNQLEARLAAEQAPAVCPQPYVSTGDATLDPIFMVDYPCGWHVLRDARPSDTKDPNKPGLRVEFTFFSRLPISLAPRTGPLADVELANWADDPGAEGDALPPLSQWLEEERARFQGAPKESTFEGGASTEVHQLTGSQDIAGEPAPVIVLLWEFDDTLTGARHVVRVFAVAPGAKAREALDRMARSFSLPQR